MARPGLSLLPGGSAATERVSLEDEWVSVSHSVVSDSLWPPWTLQAPLSMGFSRPEYWSRQPFPSPGDLPLPGIEPRTPRDSLPAKPPEKPKNTGVGSLSLLQGIFPAQESNQGRLHCRQILYQLSYHGSPMMLKLAKALTLKKKKWC